MTDTTTTDIPATTAPTGRRRSPKATPGQVMELARTLPPARDVLRRACDDATPGQLGFLAGLSGDGERQQGRIQTRPPAPAGRLPAIQDTRRIRPGAWPRSPPTGDANSSPASSSWTGPRTSCSTATSDAARHTWPSRSGGPACRRMIPAGFFTASSLAVRLRKAKHDNRLDTELKTIGKTEPPVIDGPGYLPIDIEGARLLFQVIADSYETRSVGVRLEPGIRQVGRRVRRRRHGRRGHRPHRPPRAHRQVPRRILQEHPLTNETAKQHQ